VHGFRASQLPALGAREVRLDEETRHAGLETGAGAARAEERCRGSAPRRGYRNDEEAVEAAPRACPDGCQAAGDSVRRALRAAIAVVPHV